MAFDCVLIKVRGFVINLSPSVMKVGGDPRRRAADQFHGLQHWKPCTSGQFASKALGSRAQQPLRGLASRRETAGGT